MGKKERHWVEAQKKIVKRRKRWAQKLNNFLNKRRRRKLWKKIEISWRLDALKENDRSFKDCIT